MSKHCDCRPGTNENGWHEVRCPPCIAVDRAIWAKAMEMSRRIAREWAARQSPNRNNH